LLNEISAIVSLILIKFGTRMTSMSIPGDCIHKGMRTQKVLITFYFLHQNSTKSGNERLHAKCVKYWIFYNIFVIVRPILMKYCMAKHIRLPKQMSDQKFGILKSKLTDDGQLENWEKFHFSTILYSKTVKKEK